MTDAEDQADDDDAGALFDVPELRIDPLARGRAEAGLMHALAAAEKGGTLIAEAAGLAGGALVAARQLDRAEAMGEKLGGLKAGYLVAQLLTPFREACQALGLPVEIVPAGGRLPAGGTSDAKPEWWDDAFGRPS